MIPIDELVLDLARSREEPVCPVSIAILLTKGRELEAGELGALMTVAECSLERIRAAGLMQLDEDGRFWTMRN